MEQKTNDQQHIIDALSVADYMYVWEKVKFVGYKKVPDMNDRNLIFWDVVTKFDYTINNNFIHYYSKHLGYYSNSKNDTFIIPTSRGVIGHLKSEYISPTECNKSKIAKDLRNWNNY